MTYREITAAIDAYVERQKVEQERIKADMQVQAIVAYRQTFLFGRVVAQVMGDKRKLPSLDKAFPGIFPEDMIRPKQQNWRAMKDRIAAYGEAWKRKRGEQRGHDNRGTASTDHGRDARSAEELGSSQKATRTNGSGSK